MPSITALSAGPAVMFGAIPARGEESATHTQKHTHTCSMRSSEIKVIMRDINSFGPNKADDS